MDGRIEIDAKEITQSLKSLLPLTLVQVDRTEGENLWDELIRRYHYLGYQKMIGQRIKYLVKSKEQVIAAISFNRPAQHVAARDDYIGWNEEKRIKQLKYLISNNRFLILPWVHVRNLASHILSISLNQVKRDWEKTFGVKPMIVETFVDTSKYQGTCYKASNWIYVGETKGYGKIGKRFEYHGNKKSVYLYELDHKYRNKLDLKVKQLKKPTPSQIKQWEELLVLLNTPDWDERILEECGLDETEVKGLGDKLCTYLNEFTEACYNGKQMKLICTFIKGLFSNLVRKSIEPIALRYGDKTGVRNLQMFFAKSTVSQDKILEIHREHVKQVIGEENGMINVDGSDFPKKGTNSVGVARQHCGILGKTDNCQAGVFAGYSSTKGYSLLDRELYLPHKWFSDEYKEKREKCGVPEDIKFKTKNEIALEMITKLSESGMPYKWIGCDGAFGSNREFLEGLPKDSYYFADVHENQLVFHEKPEMIMPSNDKGRGRKCKYPRPSIEPVNVKKIAEDPNIQWETSYLGEGSKGPIYAKTKCIRVIRTAVGNGGVACAEPLDEVWLYIRQYENNRIKYSFCNAPADIPRKELDRAATMRWPIEQCFNECKSYLGMDHYESRTWQAWYLHMLLVMVAHFFTIIMRHSFKKDTPVLTMPMVSKLIGASLTGSDDFIKKILIEIKYYLKRNYIAYKSHSKRMLNQPLAL